MPVDADIFATLSESVAAADVQAFADDLSEQIGPQRFCHDFDGAGVIQLVPPHDYAYLPDNLPAAAAVLRVPMTGAYYGPGYERGYWPEIAGVLEFLRRRLPGGRVWYGPDCGDSVQEVTPAFLDAMWAHWATHGGRPYYRK